MALSRSAKAGTNTVQKWYSVGRWHASSAMLLPELCGAAAPSDGFSVASGIWR